MMNLTNDYLAQFNKVTARVNDQVLREVEQRLEKPVETLTQEDVIRYKTLIDGQAPNTVRRKLNTLSGFYNYLARRGVIERNPVVAVRIPKSDRVRTIKWLTEEDVDLLFEKEYDSMRKAVLHAGLSGLRVSEIVSLNVEQYRDGRLWNVEGKGGKVRTVPLTLQAAQAIEECIGERTSGPLIVARGRSRVSTRTVQYWVSESIWEALGKRMSAHALRHTHATLLAKADVPVLKIGRILGHSSPAVTEIYTHIDDNDLVQEVRRLDRPVRRPQLAVIERTA